MPQERDSLGFRTFSKRGFGFQDGGWEGDRKGKKFCLVDSLRFRFVYEILLDMVDWGV